MGYESKTITFGALMFIAFLLSNTATAGGYFLTDVGSKGAGRAGAFVAGAVRNPRSWADASRVSSFPRNLSASQVPRAQARA